MYIYTLSSNIINALVEISCVGCGSSTEEKQQQQYNLQQDLAERNAQ